MQKQVSKHVKTALAALALVSMAPFALAQPAAPSVKTIVLSQDFQKKLEKNYGVREADWLKAELQRAVERSLGKAGQTKVAWVDLTITDAKPNKPTFEQMSKNTSISYSDSFSLGGAKVEATLYDASGAVLSKVKHSWFSTRLEDITSFATWSDANRAFEGAARKIRQEAQRDI